MMRQFLLTLAVAILDVSAFAQVPNDNVRERILLSVDGRPFFTNTFHSTVEDACINRNLTKKCLVYHNDQWFYFTVTDSGRHYLNIGSQECRDKKGIQVVLIEGDPCVVSSYKLIYCLPQIPQEDTYLVLDSLREGTQYLVNIDGFLGDYCSFTVQVAHHASGLPIQPRQKDSLQLAIRTSGRRVELNWNADAPLLSALAGFDIYRRTNARPDAFVGTVNELRSNALGTFSTRYGFVDSVAAPGLYVYDVFGVHRATHELELLMEKQIWVSASIDALDRPGPRDYRIAIPVDVHRKTAMVIHIIDITANQLLSYLEVVAARKQSAISIDLGSYVQQGTRNFHVRVFQKDADAPRELYYVIKDSGELVQR
jgi:hypothetical protein